MLTQEQIAVLRDRAGQLADPINDFLLEDIARRISEAGQLTSTAAYQVWCAQNLGMSQREIKKELRKLLKVSHRDIRKLLTQSAETGYDFDIRYLPQVQAIPFYRNAVIQEIVRSAVELAQEDFTNLTQSLGMVDPYGRALPIQAAYRSCTDFAFQQIITGAADYNTAIRMATRNLAEQGVQTIDYASGYHTSLEAAVRRSVMGGLGLMQEQISQKNHDDFGCDGWEISAHAASAPDHEPIQGRQYSDADYAALNNSLVRRIGTLNCGHAAFPIILGVSPPQYTAEELEKLRADNEQGVTIGGRHYTMYEATQHQRKLERSLRMQKRRVLTDEAAGDDKKLLADKIRLQQLRQEYKRFSEQAGLRTQYERAEVAGFGHREASRTRAAVNTEIKRLNAIKTSGIMRYENNAFGFDGYTAEQYTDMLSRRNIVQLDQNVTSLPMDGDSNSITDLLNASGDVKQRRIYGPQGKAVVDFDTDDHGKPKWHPTGAHKHIFNHNNKKPRGKQEALTEADLALNADIIREGENYHAQKTDGAD